MQFIDLKKQYLGIKDLIDQNINQVLEHGRYVFGPEITELEQKLADYVGVKHCIACSSGTDALLMPLMAWGIGPGDAVFTSPFTFIATAEVVSLVHATPVFVDIDKDTFNIDCDKLEAAIIKTIEEGKLKPKAIMPVDLFGLPADNDRITEIAKKYNLLLLEDAAQGFGGNINGRRACSWGDAAATSFFPAKPLGCYGDGGAIFTNDDKLKDLLHSIRVHGMSPEDRYNNVRVGINGRIDSIQAGILLAKMTVFDQELIERNRVADLYNKLLAGKVKTPTTPAGYYSSWAQYTVQCDSPAHKNELLEKLKAANIPTAIYYPIPLHLQTAYSHLNYEKGSLPVAESVAELVFSLPMHPYLTNEEVEEICAVF